MPSPSGAHTGVKEKLRSILSPGRTSRGAFELGEKIGRWHRVNKTTMNIDITSNIEGTRNAI